MDPNPFELGVVGLALMVVWKLLDLGKTYLVPKRREGDSVVPSMSALACQVDPRHYEHIKDVFDFSERVSQQISEGKFDCAWRGRDEVRDMLESTRALTAAVTQLNSAVAQLNTNVQHLTTTVKSRQ